MGNANIDNPTFKSRTKEKLTTKLSKFRSMSKVPEEIKKSVINKIEKRFKKSLDLPIHGKEARIKKEKAAEKEIAIKIEIGREKAKEERSARKKRKKHELRKEKSVVKNELKTEDVGPVNDGDTNDIASHV